MLVGDGALGHLLPAGPAGLSERAAELSREHDVVVAASPPEVAVRLVTWHRSTAAPDRRPGTARLGDGVSQRRAAESVDERLLTAPCKYHNIHQPSTINRATHFHRRYELILHVEEILLFKKFFFNCRYML